jgi:nucleotide-binding universal stress UspA family protein
MKVIFGIDNQGVYKPAIALFARFRFEKPEVTLAHFMNPTAAFLPVEAPDAMELQAEFVKAVENAGRETLHLAKDEACMRNISSRQQLQLGPAAHGLTQLAEDTHADLVAVCAERGSMWSTSFLGSVSRGLATHCASSILIAKGKVKEAAPLKVVLATDHSKESTRWIRKFLSWKPHGISEVHVVTAYQIDDFEASILHRNLPSLGGMVDAWVEEHLAKKNAELVELLTAAGIKATAHIGCGGANDVIRTTMQDTQADVLVIGAQGHGFLERLFIGSTSLHQVSAEPYPVLVVRS